MTPTEIASLIVQRWRDGHSVKSIRVQLLCLSVKLTDARILAAIRVYTDHCSENKKLGGKRELS